MKERETISSKITSFTRGFRREEQLQLATATDYDTSYRSTPTSYIKELLPANLNFRAYLKELNIKGANQHMTKRAFLIDSTSAYEPDDIPCCQEMGQSEQADLTADKIFYACMRCADIVFPKANICQLGMDQRNVGVITREFYDDNKPIILLHHMLSGLLKGQEKMSKSDASFAVFMDDNEDEVNLKIKKAFCPPNIVEGNPCLEYIKHIVFPCFKEFKVERKAKNGGEKTFEEVIADYKEGDMHPADLKPALSKALNRILQCLLPQFLLNFYKAEAIGPLMNILQSRVSLPEELTH
ncbi:tyrosine--tRNA ligase 1, cytoplasmic-like protein [Tanacetum coccineum]